MSHGLIILLALGGFIELGIAQRHVEFLVPHEFFDDFERYNVPQKLDRSLRYKMGVPWECKKEPS